MVNVFRAWFRLRFVRWALPCVAILFAFGMAPFAAHAGDVLRAPIRGSEMAGFGRMIISFDQLPGVEVTQLNGVLILNFDRPVAMDLSHIGIEIPNYISSGRIDPDGRGIRFAVAKSLRPNLIEAGNDLYVDLLPSGWKGPLRYRAWEQLRPTTRKIETRLILTMLAKIAAYQRTSTINYVTAYETAGLGVEILEALIVGSAFAGATE